MGHHKSDLTTQFGDADPRRAGALKDNLTEEQTRVRRAVLRCVPPGPSQDEILEMLCL